MDLTSLQSILSRAGQARIACVGDVMVDRYVYGEVARVSPEAPIPVLAGRSEAVMLGAVGNVARNLAALGVATVALVGVVGDDPAADEAARLIEAETAIEGHLVTERGRTTTVKTRFVASGQQLLRLDYENDAPLAPSADNSLAAAAAAAIQGCAAVLISDYAKGAVSLTVMAAVRKAAKAAGAPIIVDPKGRSFAKYGAVDLIKPNDRELSLVLDRRMDSDADFEDGLAAALDGCLARAILVTRGGKGASLAVRGEPVVHFRPPPRTVFDNSGAGDTTLAGVGAALAAGASLPEAVEFAMLAAGVAVGKIGTAVVTPAELVAAEMANPLAPAEAKVATLQRAIEEASLWRAAGLRVGFTNGCFDILHRGHVAYLAQARAWCDRLIVAVNSDASVKRLKGEGRPINDLDSRALVLAGLGSVDLVTPFDEDTPITLIEAIKPDVLIKGADYTLEGVVGGDLVQSYGGEVRLAPLVEGYSTTAAIARMGQGG